MATRGYKLGRRQVAVDRTRAAILAAARDALAGGGLNLGAVAARAGVSRLTVYSRFGSKAGLMEALGAQALRQAPEPRPLQGDGRAALEERLLASCEQWASDPALFRRLPEEGRFDHRDLAEFLASTDRLRPGCSIKEAEDVIGVLTSFGTFDRLHQDGRRSAAAVVRILMRLAEGILT